MERSCGDAAKKKDGDCLQQSWRVFVQNRRIGVPSYVTGVGSACKRGWSPWDGAKKKRASQKLDSQFIISPQTPRLPSLFCHACGARAHTPVPSLQMHMWVHLSVVPSRAAPGS